MYNFSIILSEIPGPDLIALKRESWLEKDLKRYDS
jgi:hypothetical protein